MIYPDQSDGSTITITEGTTYTFYNISGDERTAQSLIGNSSVTSNYFATESSSKEVPYGYIDESQNIIMLA